MYNIYRCVLQAEQHGVVSSSWRHLLGPIVQYYRCLLSRVLLASAILDVGHLETGRLVRLTQSMRALGLVALSKVEGAILVPTVMADRVEDVNQLVVLGNPAVGVVEARRNVVHAVCCGEGQRAVVEQVATLVRRDKLVLHVDAAALVRLLRGRLAEREVVPSVVGDVVGATGLVNLEEVQAASLIGDLDANVVAVDDLRPVGDAVGVNFASQHADRGRVLLVRSDAGGLSPLGRNCAGRDGDS